MDRPITLHQRPSSKFQMDGAYSVTTPVSVGQKLVKATEESELFDEALYQSAIGPSARMRERVTIVLFLSVCENNIWELTPLQPLKYAPNGRRPHFIGFKTLSLPIKSEIHFLCQDTFLLNLITY